MIDFNFEEHIKTNIINGVKNGTFTKECANIMASNYCIKNVITKEDVATISTELNAWEESQKVTEEVPQEEATEEPTEEVIEEVIENLEATE